ncbi:MAG: Uma2 family endonuclease [Pirellulaceae bacterium]
MSIAEKLMSAAEFGESSGGRYAELVRGRVVEMIPPKRKHGKVVFSIARIVGAYVEANDLGHWFGESGVVTEREPDTVRGPDAAFASYERIPRGVDDDEYCQVAPELIFEVFSPSDRWVEVLEKVAEYLRAGVVVVCVVVPSTRSVQLHRADGTPATLAESDFLELPDILPGFRCLVADFFPRAKKV